MTDRELLELAAKAADLDVEWHEYCFYLGGDEWWPLTDDGDALRLAVKLGLFVGKSAIEKEKYFAGRNDLDGSYRDTCIRRSIVRAASAIGEAME